MKQGGKVSMPGLRLHIAICGNTRDCGPVGRRLEFGRLGYLCGDWYWLPSLRSELPTRGAGQLPAVRMYPLVVAVAASLP